VLKRFENQTVTCEYKYDGERAQVLSLLALPSTKVQILTQKALQIHVVPGGGIKIFSRNSEDSTGTQFACFC
jgi:DNA ligase-1